MSVPMFVATIALTIVSFVVRGWSLSIMWTWFVATQFGLPSLSYPEALGISGLVAMLTANPMLKTEERDYWQNLLLSIVINLFSVGLGWIWKLLL